MMRRRDFLSGIGVSAGLIGAGSIPAASQPLSDFETFLRLRASPEGTPTFWWYSGHMLGRLQDQPAKRIFIMKGASRSVISREPDGSVTYSLTEAGYYCDPDSGEIADGPMINRLTGEDITPVHYLSPQTQRFHPDLRVTPVIDRLPPGLEYEGHITPPDRKYGRVWMAEELFVKMPASEKRPARIANSLANFEAAVSDVESGKPFTPATMEYTTWNSFRPWMNMGDRKGSIMMRLNGLKLQQWSEVDHGLRARIEQDHGGEFWNA